MEKKLYIGYSSDPQIRYKATSGGVGTAIVKFLLDNKMVDYALTFYYDNSTKLYSPKLIDSFDKYIITGSVYQEIDMKPFYKNVFSKVNTNKKIVVFALPCQTPFIRYLAKKWSISVVIIGLTCSSQQKIEATQYLFKRINVNIDDVKDYKYRGNGWPSGVQIKTLGGKDYFIPNNNSIWTSIFHSRLFIPHRCFKCQDTLNKGCDIILADPWLPDCIKEEKIGKSLFMSYTKVGQGIIDFILQNNLIEASLLSQDLLSQSQWSTIVRKKGYRMHPKKRDLLMNLVSNKVYRKFVLTSKITYKFHIQIKDFLEKRMR